MTTLPAHTSRAIHNKGMQAVYGIAAEYDVDVSDVIALLGTTSHTSISSAHSPFTRLPDTTPSETRTPVSTPSTDHIADAGKMVATPSQPETHAPAADTPATQAAGDTTDGEEEQASSLPPFLSVDPIPEQTAERAPDHGSETVLKETASDEGESNSRPPARRHASTDSRDGALANGLGTAQCEDGASPALPSDPSTPPKLMSKREQVRACHIEHPDWTSHQIAEHLGFGVQHVQIMASHLSLKLPRAPRAGTENLRDKVLAVIAAHPEWALRKVATEAGCSLGTASKWAKEARSGPPEAEQTSDEPQAETAPELPPVSLPSERLQPPPVVRRARAAPTGRFYLRDKTTGHFVHQSLQPNAAGDGPMMTFDRKWAWYDTMERYRGAKKRWPQIDALRKEAVSK